MLNRVCRTTTFSELLTSLTPFRDVVKAALLVDDDADTLDAWLSVRHSKG